MARTGLPVQPAPLLTSPAPNGPAGIPAGPLCVYAGQVDFYDAEEDLGGFSLELHGDDERQAAYAFWDAIAERMARDDGLETIGTWGADLHGVGLAKPSAAKLTEYWTHGKGAADIKWGVKGSMTRCIRHLTGKVRTPGGLCADYHKIATGEWPTEHGKAGIPS